MTALLTADHVTCTVAGEAVLEDVTLEVHAGERVAIFGPSGSGKTTLLSTLGGITPAQAGRVLLDGEDVQAPGVLGREVAFVLQTHGVLALLTAAENVEVALRAQGSGGRQARKLAAEMLERLRVGPFADHLADELSGGQEQRVAVARALAVRPRLLLADEPTSEQDAEHREVVMENLLAVAEAGAGLVIATNDEDVAQRCDRIFHLGREEAPHVESSAP